MKTGHKVAEIRATEAKERFAFPDLSPEQQLAHLSSLIEHSLDGIFTAELSGRIISWNAAASSIYGYSAEEMIGSDVSRVVPSDRRNERRDVIARIIAGESVPPYETQRLRKDGRLIDVYVTISPVRDFAGRVIAVSTIARDITQRKQAEAALMQKQRELEDYFENAEVGLHWVGPDGRIIWANRAEMEPLGYTAEEYIGHHIAEFHADTEAIEDILGRLGRNEKLHGYEARLRCKDNSIRHVLISSSVLWENGRFVHTRCFTIDVTARRLAEEALRRTEKMAATGRLAASIAHEINNPLEAVVNLLYLAQNTATNADVRTYLQRADAELKRVAHIARRTLGFFRDGTELRRVALDALVRDVFSIYHSRVEARQIQVDFDLAPVCVMGYEGELRQAVSNLLLNAIEALPQRGNIKVRVAQHGSTVACVVADNGTGITCADRCRIFEPFFTTKAATGTGLGLWVTKEMVRKHHGRMQFRTSTRPGASGTAFRITLPAAA
jgi:PAS domain S-box-containing protein